MLQVLNRMYICFSVPPYTKKLPRAVQKPPKVYFFDNADVVGGNDQEGPRFENLTASHLLKKMHYLEDSRGLRLDLRYIRDKESREVDFVLLREGEVFGLIEVKFPTARYPALSNTTRKNSGRSMFCKSQLTLRESAASGKGALSGFKKPFAFYLTTSDSRFLLKCSMRNIFCLNSSEAPLGAGERV